jgi:DNA-binding CsgD family transcriptional regulator
MEKDDFRASLSFGPDRFGGPDWAELAGPDLAAAAIASSAVPLLQDLDGTAIRRNFIHVSDLVSAWKRDMSLSTHELTQFNRAILAVHGAASTDAFPRHLLQALRLVVPGDIGVADFSGIAEVRAFTAYDPGSAIPAAVNAAVHRHLRDNPLYGRRHARATSISDLMTRRAWHRTALYGEAYGQVGQEDGLALDVDLGCGGMLTLNVTRSRRGYSAAERLSLGLLRPHVHAQWTRLRTEQRWRDALARSAPSVLDALSARERDVLAWVAGGKSNRAIADLLDLRPGTVKRHLENIYRKLGVSGRRDAAMLVPPTTTEMGSG